MLLNHLVRRRVFENTHSKADLPSEFLLKSLATVVPHASDGIHAKRERSRECAAFMRLLVQRRGILGKTRTPKDTQESQALRMTSRFELLCELFRRSISSHSASASTPKASFPLNPNVLKDPSTSEDRLCDPDDARRDNSHLVNSAE